MRFFCFLVMLLLAEGVSGAARDSVKLFTADNPRIQYTGRMDVSDKLRPRIWAPGAYIVARFKGPECQVLIDDQVEWGHNHNYIEIVVDDRAPYRVQLTTKTNVLDLPAGLSDGEHTVLICKDTESNIGYIDFVGFRCAGLLPPPKKAKRKIEYFGDSITSGTGMDLSVIPCDKGEWYDQHNAYMAYGPRTSRNLGAQWHLTALAGLGLVHSCCNMTVTMPQIYDKVYLSSDKIAWDFSKYQPDVVTVCLGQNDGPQDSTLFCGTYVKFIETLRRHYQKADIICLTSPMADAKLLPVLKRYLTGITGHMRAAGDKKVSQYFFSRQYHSGCGGHPDLAEHELIANELTAYIKRLKGW